MSHRSLDRSLKRHYIQMYLITVCIHGTDTVSNQIQDSQTSFVYGILDNNKEKQTEKKILCCFTLENIILFVFDNVLLLIWSK